MSTPTKDLNRISIQGFIIEKDLEVRQEKDAIVGSITIGIPHKKIDGSFTYAIEEMDQIPINIWSSRLTKKGTPSKSYALFEKIITEGVSLASCGDLEKTSTISLGGSISENTFVTGDLKLITSNRIRINYGEFVSKEVFDPGCKIELIGTILDIQPEFDEEGIETGSKKITMLQRSVFGNGFTNVLSFHVDKPEAVSYIELTWNVGNTVRIVSTIQRKVVEKEVVIEMGFGENDTQTRKMGEKPRYVIISGSEPFEEAGEMAAYMISAEIVKELLAERSKSNDAKLSAKKDEVGSGQEAPKAAFDF